MSTSFDCAARVAEIATSTEEANVKRAATMKTRRLASSLLVSTTCFVAAAATPIAMAVNPRVELASSPAAASVVVVLLFGVLLLALHAWFRSTSHSSAAESPESAILHPPVQMVWYAALMFAVPGYYGAAHPSAIASLVGRVQLDYSYVAWGLLLVFVGSVALCAGYAIGVKIFSPFRWSTRMGRSQPRFGAVMAAYIGLVAMQLIKLGTTGVAYAADTGFQSPSLFMAWIDYSLGAIPLALAIMIIGAIRHGWPHFPIGMAWLLQCGLVFISGFSKPMLNLILVFFLAMMLAGVRMRRLVMPALVGLVLAIMVVPISEGLRAQTLDGRFDGGVSTAPAAVLTALDETWGQGTSVGLTIFADKLIARQAQSAMSPGVIMSVTPSLLPFQDAQKLLALPAYLVPRALWPDKPVITSGRWLSSTYFGYARSTVTSSAATLYGHLYIYGGWSVAVAGSLVLGMVLAFVARNTLYVGLGAVLVALTPVYIHVGSDYFTEVLAIMQQLIVLFIVYWLILSLSVKKRPTHAPSVPSVDSNREI